MASSDSATGFIKRNRPPRVQISYADPIDANRQVELPFVMGVMSDLSGTGPLAVTQIASFDTNYAPIAAAMQLIEFGMPLLIFVVPSTGSRAM